MWAQAMHNKFSRGSFSVEDMIKVSDFLDCELYMDMGNNQKIIFDISDLRDKE